MNLKFYSSPVKVDSKKKQWIINHLKKFQTADLAKLSEKQLQKSIELYQEINSSSSLIFIFAFGGIRASFRIAQAFFSVQNEKVTLVDSLDIIFKNRISKLSSEELSSAHFVFISKSGQTSEILFYKQLVTRLYFKNRLSLKNKLTLLTQNLNSPLLLWGKKEHAHVLYLEDSLPGRFSFFSLSGWFQFLACGLKISSHELKSVSVNSQIFDFFPLLFEKKEICFCPFQPELNAISYWLEISWSESLFKENMKQQAPLLRVIPWRDLRHGFIEELVAKREQVCFWGLDIKSDKTEPLKDKLFRLLKSKNIAYLFISAEKELPAFFDLILVLYKTLFLAGEFSGVDIRTQPWVDYFKK